MPSTIIKNKMYGGKVVINFEEEKHKFTFENGERIESVTSFTGILDKSNYLIPWALRLAKEYVLSHKAGNLEEVLAEACRQHAIRRDKAADIGEQIHTWIEKWIGNKKQPIPEDKNVRNGVMAFLEFQKKNNVKWLESERIIYSKKYNFAGFLDAVGKIKNKLVLVDFKSGNSIYSEYYFQTAGYQLAYEEETGKKIDHRMIIRLGKDDGAFEVREINNYDNDRKAFLACVAIKRRLKEI